MKGAEKHKPRAFLRACSSFGSLVLVLLPLRFPPETLRTGSSSNSSSSDTRMARIPDVSPQTPPAPLYASFCSGHNPTAADERLLLYHQGGASLPPPTAVAGQHSASETFSSAPKMPPVKSRADLTFTITFYEAFQNQRWDI